MYKGVFLGGLSKLKERNKWKAVRNWINLVRCSNEWLYKENVEEN